MIGTAEDRAQNHCVRDSDSTSAPQWQIRFANSMAYGTLRFNAAFTRIFVNAAMNLRVP